MSLEQYTNFATSTCTGTISSATNPATIVLNSGDGTLFPATTGGPFRITVANSDRTNTEVMIVTTRATDTLTAYRGTAISTYGAQETPVPTLSTHSAGSVVIHAITAGAVQEVLTERSTLYTPPSGFTLQDGIGSSTAYTDLYGFTLWTPNSGGNNVIYLETALATTSAYTATFGFRGVMAQDNSTQVGVLISDGTKLQTWRFRNDGANDIYYWTAYNNPSAGQNSEGVRHWGQNGVIVQIKNDNTHRTWFLMDSRMRASVQIYQESHTANLTETQVGFFALANNGFAGIVEAFHFGVTYP